MIEEELNYVGQRSQNTCFNSYTRQYGPRNNWNYNQWTSPPMQPPHTSWRPREWVSPQWNQCNQPQWNP